MVASSLFCVMFNSSFAMEIKNEINSSELNIENDKIEKLKNFFYKKRAKEEFEQFRINLKEEYRGIAIDYYRKCDKSMEKIKKFVNEDVNYFKSILDEIKSLDEINGFKIDEIKRVKISEEKNIDELEEIENYRNEIKNRYRNSIINYYKYTNDLEKIKEIINEDIIYFSSIINEINGINLVYFFNLPQDKTEGEKNIGELEELGENIGSTEIKIKQLKNKYENIILKYFELKILTKENINSLLNLKENINKEIGFILSILEEEKNKFSSLENNLNKKLDLVVKKMRYYEELKAEVEHVISNVIDICKVEGIIDENKTVEKGCSNNQASLQNSKNIKLFDFDKHNISNKNSIFGIGTDNADLLLGRKRNNEKSSNKGDNEENLNKIIMKKEDDNENNIIVEDSKNSIIGKEDAEVLSGKKKNKWKKGKNLNKIIMRKEDEDIELLKLKRQYEQSSDSSWISDNSAFNVYMISLPVFIVDNESTAKYKNNLRYYGWYIKEFFNYIFYLLLEEDKDRFKNCSVWYPLNYLDELKKQLKIVDKSWSCSFISFLYPKKDGESDLGNLGWLPKSLDDVKFVMEHLQKVKTCINSLPESKKIDSTFDFGSFEQSYDKLFTVLSNKIEHKDATYSTFIRNISENYRSIVACIKLLIDRLNSLDLETLESLISKNEDLCKQMGDDIEFKYGKDLFNEFEKCTNKINSILIKYKNKLERYLKGDLFENLKRSFYKFVKYSINYISENNSNVGDEWFSDKLVLFSEGFDILKDLKLEDLKRYSDFAYVWVMPFVKYDKNDKKYIKDLSIWQGEHLHEFFLLNKNDLKKIEYDPQKTNDVQQVKFDPQKTNDVQQVKFDPQKTNDVQQRDDVKKIFSCMAFRMFEQEAANNRKMKNHFPIYNYQHSSNGGEDYYVIGCRDFNISKDTYYNNVGFPKNHLERLSKDAYMIKLIKENVINYVKKINLEDLDKEDSLLKKRDLDSVFSIGKTYDEKLNFLKKCADEWIVYSRFFYENFPEGVNIEDLNENYRNFLEYSNKYENDKILEKNYWKGFPTYYGFIGKENFLILLELISRYLKKSLAKYLSDNYSKYGWIDSDVLNISYLYWNYVMGIDLKLRYVGEDVNIGDIVDHITNDLLPKAYLNVVKDFKYFHMLSPTRIKNLEEIIRKINAANCGIREKNALEDGVIFGPRDFESTAAGKKIGDFVDSFHFNIYVTRTPQGYVFTPVNGTNDVYVTQSETNRRILTHFGPNFLAELDEETIDENRNEKPVEIKYEMDRVVPNKSENIFEKQQQLLQDIRQDFYKILNYDPKNGIYKKNENNVK